MIIQCLLIKFGFHFHDHVLTGLILLYSKCEEMEMLRQLFELIGKPNIF